jgi:hypothetical protein
MATGAFSSGPPVAIQSLPSAQTSGATASYQTNANGQTYGSLQNATSSATSPVLTRAQATNGQTGYVYTSQLNGVAPSSPAEALAQQAVDTTPQYIPVYAQDGTTVIGQFEATEPESESTVTTASSGN